MEYINRDISRLIAEKTVQAETMTLAVYNDCDALICFANKNMRTPELYELYTVVKGDIESHSFGKESDCELSKKFVCKSKIKLIALVEKFVEELWCHISSEEDEYLYFSYNEGLNKHPPFISKRDDKKNDDLSFLVTVPCEEMCDCERNNFITNEITENMVKMLEF